MPRAEYEDRRLTTVGKYLLLLAQFIILPCVSKSESSRTMRTVNLLWVILWVAAIPSLVAGSYPLGLFNQLFDKPDQALDLEDGSRIHSSQSTSSGLPVAAIYSGVLRLADLATPNAISSFKLPDLDPGNVVKSFDIKFSITMNASPGSAAGEGWSLNFGLVPEDDGTGEGGFVPLPRGLTIAFDTFNNGDDPPSIQVLVGNVVIANFPRTFTFDASARQVVLHWDATGLDISFDNKPVCADLFTPGFAPAPGAQFAFSARTTTATMDVFLDNLKATTQALPVINAGSPIISEFAADNSETEDEFAAKPDWIELLNASPNPIDLAGWHLTDSPANLTKWKIPSLTLFPYQYQLIFASGRDRSLSTFSYLHAPFTLKKESGFLALVKPDGTIASSYEYGPQDRNVSFGEKGSDRIRGYMHPPSPGAPNTQDPAPASLSPEVQFSHAGGFITDPVSLILSVPNAPPGTTIVYTLNRSEPGPGSPVFAAPIPITQITTVRARAYLPGHLPSRITSRSFILMDATLSNYAETGKVFESNLPLVYVDSFGVNVDGSTGGSRPFRPSFTLVISPAPATGRATLLSPAQYAGPSGVHVRGESSAGFDQRSYSLELWDQAGKDLDAPLLGMPPDSDWVLYGPWSEKSLMRNKLVFDWMLALRGPDGTAVRTRFIELFFNQSRSPQVGFGSYRGIYLLMEKLKRGDDRLPIENLNDKTIDPELITGGYIIRKDKDDPLKSNWSSARFGIPLQSYDPDRLNSAQLSYVRNYINAFETALNGPTFKDFHSGYQAFIDPDTFIDAQWMLEIAKQVDGYVFSTYFHKDRAGRLRAGPLWDFNISLGNADYATGDRATGWLYDVPNGAGQLWYPKLHSDPDYKLAHWDRYWELRASIFNTDTVMATIDTHMNTLLDGYTGAVSNRAPASIQNPVARHFRKWPRLGSRDWPNPAGETKIKTWQQEVEYLKAWIKPRLEWLDDQSLRSGRTVLRPPILSHPGGPISAQVELSLQSYSRSDPAVVFPQGEIYYTLDKSDPRLPGGEINSAARKYSASFSVQSSLTVNARLHFQKQWSPLASATFLFQAHPASAANLIVSELMFQPLSPATNERSAGIVAASRFEYLELRNTATHAVDLSGVKLTRGVDFDFTFASPASRLLKAGESAVLVADKRAFRLRYPHVPTSKIAGQFRGHLETSGELIRLQSADGTLICQFEYNSERPWPSNQAAPGHSLILKNPSPNPNPAEPTQWTQSAKPGGTPAESGLGSDVFSGDPLKDSDGDGLSDLFEFASGSDPENPDSNHAPSAFITSNDSNASSARYFFFTSRRRASTPGLEFKIQSSSDLSFWADAGPNLTLANSQKNLDGTLTETYRSAAPVAPNSQAFFRVRIQRQ